MKILREDLQIPRFNSALGIIILTACFLTGFGGPTIYSQELKAGSKGEVNLTGTGEVVFTYSDLNPIVIGDNAPASPYPSTITAAGINPTSITRIAVTLNGFTHAFPDDVDIMLEGPTGARSIIMSDAGGTTSVSGVNLTFQQTGTPIPDDSVLTSGVVGTANYAGNDGTNDNFPAPGPGTVTNEPADLGVFAGTNPNGTWRLLIVDDKGSDIGVIAAGWNLAIVVPLSQGLVTKTADTNDGTCDADCSLREAIATGANFIQFAPLFSSPQTITLGGTELDVASSFLMTGPIADNLTISGDGVSRILRTGANQINFISGVSFSNGLADTNGGGGILNFGSLILSYCTISNNTGPIGGGIRNASGGSLTIVGSTISGNTTSSAFGAGGIESSGFLTLSNSTVSGNSSGNGIGSNAGGVKSRAGTISNTTITNNSAAGSSSAGGFYRESGTITVKNSIIANNVNNTTTADIFLNGGTGVTSFGYNLIGNAGAVTVFNQTGDQAGNGASPIDPKLAPLASNDGFTRTHALQPDSPAIDAGNSDGIAIDQRIMSRPFDFPTITNVSDGSDIGAFERQDTDIGGAVRFDFDGDAKTDIGIFRPGPGEWWYLRSSDGGSYAAQFGSGTDAITPADFTGDGKADIAFFRPTSGEWFILRSEDSSFFAFPFGVNGDIPAPGDFDGDGKADPAVFRPSIATWFYIRSSDQQVVTTQFGLNGDQPIVEDYDGDGKDDLAVFRPSVAEWYLNRSTDGFIGYQFGPVGDTTPAVADFTGDGKADITFFKPSSSEWFVLRSEDNSFFAFPFGTSGDIPVPGDYDGDGTADPAVFRPSTNSWFLQQTTSGFEQVQFGITNDIPVPSAYVTP